MFDAQQTEGKVLRSEESLTVRHSPKVPVGRDRELRRIADAVRPVTMGRPPENLLIHGPAGVGKTTCVLHVLDRLNSEGGVDSAHINSWRYNTRPSVLTQILIELGRPVPRKGKPVDEVVERLVELLDGVRGAVVALDEFDQLQNQTEVIYDLVHAGRESGGGFGLLMVSNKHPTTIELDPRSESRLSCRTLEFRPYTHEELVAILRERAENAVKPGCIEDGVIERIAAEAASDGGDCRQALNLFLRAARTAEQDGTGRITLEVLDEVR